MGYTVEGKNKMLDALGVTHVGLLDETGTELTGGTPAYARKAITWNPAANGALVASNQPVFDVPASKTIASVIFMSAVTGGTELARADIAQESYNNQGTYTLTSATLDLNG